MSLTTESLEALLTWLDPNRDRAGLKYETIRSGLIKIFQSKGFTDAEDLADQTIDRVIVRLPDLRESYDGEPVRYFRGVARNIIFEAWRRREVSIDATLPAPPPLIQTSDEHECLLKCLKFLTEEERELALDYHTYRGSEKVIQHRCMAEEKGLTVTALRVRVHRIRVCLEKCVIECLRTSRAETKTPAASIIIDMPSDRRH